MQIATVFRVCFIAGIITFSSANFTQAQSSRQISYQGVVTQGDAKISDGWYSLTFALYGSVGSSVPLWQEEQRVYFQHGLFNVMLGAEFPLPERLPEDAWIGISFQGSGEFTRTKLTAVPYAMQAGIAEKAMYAEKAGELEGGVVSSINGIQGNVLMKASDGLEIRTDEEGGLIVGLSNEKRYEGILNQGTEWLLAGNTNANASSWLGTSNNFPLVIRTNNTERMRILSSNGNIGMGTTSPAERLHIVGNAQVDGNIVIKPTSSTSGELRIMENGGTQYTAFKSPQLSNNVIYTLPINDGSNGDVLTSDGSGVLSWQSVDGWGLSGNVVGAGKFIGTLNAQPLSFRTNNAERMSIGTTGNVAIGDETTSSKLTVAQSLFITNTGGTPEIKIEAPNNTTSTILKTTNQSANIVYTLPPNDGNNGQFLRTNGSGVLTWADAGGSGGGGGGLDYFGEIRTTYYAPNAAVPVHLIRPFGTEENIDFVLSPKGTGAIMADEPNGLAIGGNKRGTNAVDWQMSRENPNQVASGDYSTIGGGSGNRASGDYSFVGGGADNTASNHRSFVGGGLENTASSPYSFVGGGADNTASGLTSFVGGGEDNTASGWYSFVGGGKDNTASGDWYSFVGGGADNTAFGLISFVGGGSVNTASGGHSFVGGGEDNTASGGHSFVGGGEENTASGDWYSFVGGGKENTASGWYSFVGGGYGNTASGWYSFVGGGYGNTASGDLSVIPGGRGLILDANANRSFGCHANNVDGTRNMTISAANTAVFGNVDFWLANNDNSPRSLRFYEQYNAAGNFPNGTNYVGFRAPNNVSADITYTLPVSAPTNNGQVLSSTTEGVLSWAHDGIINFTSNRNTGVPNAIVPVHQLSASGGEISIDIAISSKGDGAIMADMPDGTSTGGNKRGTNAVDWQMSRGNANQVASGSSSVIMGGGSNRAGGSGATVGGGFLNNADGYNSTIDGGEQNTTSGHCSSISGGYNNTAGSWASVISGGSENIANGEFASISGGENNTVTGYYSSIIGGRGLTLHNDGSVGYLGNNFFGYRNMTISAANTAVFGNVDFWLANNDNSPRSLRFYEQYNAAGNFPNGTNYVGFRAPNNVSADITYTLPASVPTSNGQVLSSTTAGVLSWITPSGGGIVTMGGDLSGSADNAQIIANAIGSAEISDNAIITSKIADGNITMSKISQSGATNGQVLKWNDSGWSPSDDANTEYSAGTGISISSGIISSTGDTDASDDIVVSSTAGGDVSGTFSNLQIVANAVGSNEISDNAILTSKIADGNITLSKISQSGATNGQVLKWNGSAWSPSGDNSGMVNFSETRTVSAPNETRPVHQLSVVGSEANIDMALSPKGEGALTAHSANNALSGGNKRGQYAVDFQTVRSAATQVASGSRSSIGGGEQNTASGGYSRVGGGYANIASGSNSVVSGGLWNTASSLDAVISGGRSNTASGMASTVAGGESNLASAEYSFVGGGVGNQATGARSSVLGGYNNRSQSSYSVVLGGTGMTLNGSASNSFGFLGANAGNNNMTIAAANTGVLGNINLWLANNDGNAREIRFYEPNSATGTFPATGVFYTAFKAQAQDSSYTYTLPSSAPISNGQVLTASTGGTMSWATKSLKITVNNFDPDEVNAASFANFTVTANGVTTTDVISLHRVGGFGNLIVASAYVNTNNQVTIRVYNPTASPVNLGAENIIIGVIRE